MDNFKDNVVMKFLNNFAFKSAIAKKFSIYILALMVVIVIFMVISVKSEEEVFKENFEKSIEFTSGIIGESVKNAFIIQYYTFLNPLIEILTKEEDIVYVIILSEDNRVMESTIDSFANRGIDELGDAFSSAAAKDKELVLRKREDPYIRKKMLEDKRAIIQEISDLTQKYVELRLVYSYDQVKEKLKSSLSQQQEFEKNINSLNNKLLIAEEEKNSIEADTITGQISDKQKELNNLKELILSLEHLGTLIERRDKKDSLLKKMEKNNLIYEVSVPMMATEGEKYGTIRIGYSPKRANEIIHRIYIESIITGIVFILIGLLLSIFLARLITKPVEALAAGAEILGSGNLYHRIKLKTGDEMEILATSLNNMAQKLNESYSSLEQKVQERTREYLDATKELQRAYRKLQATQAQLVQSEKMTSLGQLVAGVAHELNNPIGFIYSNMGPLEQSVHTITGLIELFETLDLPQEEKAKVQKFIKENDFEFLMEDLDFLIKDIKEGADRSHKIIMDLKNFSRLDEAEYKEVDIHHGLNSTLNLLVNQYKHKVTIHREYGEVPLINCYASQLNQVWMNLLVNASQAIEEKGEVWITTALENDMLVITIRDNGKGIPKDVKERIFDPFFTTKPVGQGTGLGLSITHSIIKKHNGIIEVESEPGMGTIFTVKLPVNRDNYDEDEKISVDDFEEAQVTIGQQIKTDKV